MLLTISSAAKECLKDEENMETGKGTLHIQCASKDDHTKQNLSVYIFTEMTVPKRCQISARKVCFWWWEVTPLDDWGKYNFWFRLRSEIRQVSFEQSSKPNMTTPLYWLGSLIMAILTIPIYKLGSLGCIPQKNSIHNPQGQLVSLLPSRQKSPPKSQRPTMAERWHRGKDHCQGVPRVLLGCSRKLGSMGYFTYL